MVATQYISHASCLLCRIDNKSWTDGLQAPRSSTSIKTKPLKFGAPQSFVVCLSETPGVVTFLAQAHGRISRCDLMEPSNAQQVNSASAQRFKT